MEHFTNETIDTLSLPKFEEVELTPLRSDYKKVIYFNLVLTFLIIGGIAGTALYFIEEATRFWIPVAVAYTFLLVISVIVSMISFRNRGFAFRTHDVMYRSGALVIETTIIPYNRVQHVALHEGIISRKLGLATVEIFTAGGGGSDIKVPGIEKDHAEKIKQLLVGKILKEESVDGE